MCNEIKKYAKKKEYINKNIILYFAISHILLIYIMYI